LSSTYQYGVKVCLISSLVEWGVWAELAGLDGVGDVLVGVGGQVDVVSVPDVGQYLPSLGEATGLIGGAGLLLWLAGNVAVPGM
jgi:hypothetical protein